MECQPRRHRAAIVVAGQAIGGIAVVVVDNLVDAPRAQVGPANPVIIAGREERRLVAHVVAATLEEEVQTAAKSLLAATGLDEAGHIVGDAERVLCRQGLVEERVPPRQIPRRHLRHGCVGNQRVEDFGAAPRHAVHPAAFFVAGQDVAAHVIPLIIAAPEVSPVGAATQVFVGDVVAAQTACHLCDAVVVVGVLHGAGAGAGDAVWNVAQTLVFVQTAAPMLLMVGTWVGIAVFQHGFQGKTIVDRL